MCLLFFQIDQLKAEISKKNSELTALQTKVDTFNHQHKDQQAHIDLLKESLAAKEQHSSILQADVSPCSVGHKGFSLCQRCLTFSH